MDSYRDLVAWQRAMALASEIYRTVSTFPNRETYALSTQICRAAVSVPSNIAEGKGRLSKREYVQFLSRARGSLLEVETQLEIAMNIGYLDQARFDEVYGVAAKTGHALNGLIKSVRSQLRFPQEPKSPRAQEPTENWTTKNS